MCAYCVTFRVLSGTNWMVLPLLHTVCSSQGAFPFLCPEGKTDWEAESRRRGVFISSELERKEGALLLVQGDTAPSKQRSVAVPCCSGTPVWHWCKRVAGWVLMQHLVLAKNPVFVDRAVDFFQSFWALCSYLQHRHNGLCLQGHGCFILFFFFKLADTR